MSSLPDPSLVSPVLDDGRLPFSFEQFEPPPPVAPPPDLEDVHLRAQMIMAAAEAEADQVRERARAEGYQDGVRDGHAAARGELAPSASALATALAEARRLTSEAAATAEREAVELALRIAEKVVAGALEVQPERVLDVVRGALRAVVERERVVICVHPDDLELVRSSVVEISASLGGIEHVEIQGDRRVDRGGALIRTTVGEVDADIASKLDQARTALVAELGP